MYDKRRICYFKRVKLILGGCYEKKFIVLIMLLVIIWIGYLCTFTLDKKENVVEKVEFIILDEEELYECYDYTVFDIGKNKLYKDCGSSLVVKTIYGNIPFYQAINRKIVTKEILDNQFRKYSNANATIYKGNQYTIIYCNNGDIYLGDDNTIYKRNMCEDENLTISFENKKCDSKKSLLYTLKDERKIYSTCGSIMIDSTFYGKMTLQETLDEEYIKLSNIYTYMNYEYGVFDGGSKGFSYKASDNSLSDNDFYMTICNSTSTNNYNIIFTNKNDYNFC